MRGLSVMPPSDPIRAVATRAGASGFARSPVDRSEEHTSELQSRGHLVCRLLLEKKNLLAHGTVVLLAAILLCAPLLNGVFAALALGRFAVDREEGSAAAPRLGWVPQLLIATLAR